MKDFLKKLKLIDYLRIELEVSKQGFVNRLKENVDEGGTGIFSDPFEGFSSSKNEYKGHVGLNNFKIKRRKRLFDVNMNMAVASGTFEQREDKLIINTEINGFTGAMIPFYIFLIIFYLIFITSFLMVDNIEGGMEFFIFPFIIVHAIFMLGFPYLMMRRSVSKMKYELERDFFYMTK